MESVFSLDHFSAIAADLHYVLLLGQPLPEFLCTAWHISSQPAPSVPLVLGQRVLLVSPASRTYFGRLRSIVKLEKSSLVISVSPEPSAYGPFLPDTCHVHLPLSFVSLLLQPCLTPDLIRSLRSHRSTMAQLRSLNTYSGCACAVNLPLSMTLGLCSIRSLPHLAIHPALT